MNTVTDQSLWIHFFSFRITPRVQFLWESNMPQFHLSIRCINPSTKILLRNPMQIKQFPFEMLVYLRQIFLQLLHTWEIKSLVAPTLIILIPPYRVTPSTPRSTYFQEGMSTRFLYHSLHWMRKIFLYSIITTRNSLQPTSGCLHPYYPPTNNTSGSTHTQTQQILTISSYSILSCRYLYC